MRTKSRRTVSISPLVPRGKRANARLWAYGYADIAHACKLSLAAVRKAAKGRTRNGKREPAAFDPADLVSVCRFLVDHGALGEGEDGG